MEEGGGTHEEAVKVGTVPNGEEAVDVPVGLLGAPLLGTGAEEVVEVAHEAALVVLRGVKVSAGAVVRASSSARDRSQLEEIVGDLRGEDAGDAVVLMSAGNSRGVEECQGRGGRYRGKVRRT